MLVHEGVVCISCVGIVCRLYSSYIATYNVLQVVNSIYSASIERIDSDVARTFCTR